MHPSLLADLSARDARAPLQEALWRGGNLVARGLRAHCARCSSALMMYGTQINNLHPARRWAWAGW
eukprot:569279-Pyramimonas_sp.AAC.1